jgi:hypothetical protein
MYIGTKASGTMHLGQKSSKPFKIGQKMVQPQFSSKPKVLEQDFIQSLKKLKL